MAKGRRYRISVRALLGLVVLCGLGFGAISISVESYRREWLAEQQAIARMRQSIDDIGYRTSKVGPRWLQVLAGGARSRYFDRIESFFILMPADGQVTLLGPRNDRLIARHRSAFKSLESRGWQWIYFRPAFLAQAPPPVPAGETLRTRWTARFLAYLARLREANSSSDMDDEGPPVGNATIRAKAGASEIVITTAPGFAGAIHSLTWDGVEFIDSADHGRELQSASNLDIDGELIAEVFNPTEAGSMSDGDGPTSTSKLLRIDAKGPELSTTTRMAFWLRPGEKSEGHPARNAKDLSDHLLAKRVRIGHRSLAHAIEYDVTFTLPEGERHAIAAFEALTGYMPSRFSRFWTFDPETRSRKPLDDGPGEQELPVIFATEDGSHAMGIFSPERDKEPGYGRFRFEDQKAVKWNCVFRVRAPDGIKAGPYAYRMFVAVGTLGDVEETLAKLAAGARDR